jgi:hypothetical protein
MNFLLFENSIDGLFEVPDFNAMMKLNGNFEKARIVFLNSQ